MSGLTPWTDAEWGPSACSRMDVALDAAARPRLGTPKLISASGRSCLQTVLTDGGTLWIKHGYRLPPGEERVLEILARRWANRVPRVVATWDGGVAMEPLRGKEMNEASPVETWVSAAQTLAELAVGEQGQVQAWLDLGVRDRRPAAWQGAVESLLQSPIVRALDPALLARFEGFVPEFITRYVDAFQASATLVHQDSGCCNIYADEFGVILIDWADVVIGHPVFSCDRLLDQTPAKYREEVIGAFLEPSNFDREEFNAMRRSNVLHEVLRYHDELAYMASDSPTHTVLSRAVQSQITVLVEHESKRR